MKNKKLKNFLTKVGLKTNKKTNESEVVFMKNNIFSSNLGGDVRSYFLSHDAYCCWVVYGALLGREDGVFSVSYLDANKILEDSNGSRTKLVNSLGLTSAEADVFRKGPLHRVDILHPEKYNLRLANGYESSSNCLYNTLFTDETKPKIVFLTENSKKTVLELENGIWVDVHYGKTDGKGSVVLDSVWFEVIDDEATPPSDLARLNGKYVTTSGKIHLPNTENYTGITSGGYKEAVTDNFPNRSDEVFHYTIYGGFWDGEAEQPFEITRNITAYNNPVNSYQDIIVRIDQSVSDQALKNEIVKNYVEISFENIAAERRWMEEKGEVPKV